MGHWSAMLLSHPATVCLLVIVRCNRSSVAREVGDVVTVFYSHIKAMDNRDSDVSSGTLMAWAYQD